MKCEKCSEDAKWRLDDGINIFGSHIYIYFCDEHKISYITEMEKLKKDLGVNLRRPDE